MKCMSRHSRERHIRSDLFRKRHFKGEKKPGLVNRVNFLYQARLVTAADTVLLVPANCAQY